MEKNKKKPKYENQVQKTYTSKNTYLLSAPFPQEEIKLGKTKDDVLRLLYKEENPNSISKKLNIARSTTIQHLQELRKKGLVKKGKNDDFKELKYGEKWVVSDKGKFLIEKSVGIPAISSHKGELSDKKKIRGHAFIWKIKPNKEFNWNSLLDEKKISFVPKGISKTPRIIINRKKVWLGKNYITIFMPKEDSFFAKEPIKSRNNAIYELTKDIEGLKKLFGISFDYKFTCRRQHYGFVGNPDARLFIKNKKKILIKDEKGFWFSIDFSQNKYEEAEILQDDFKLTTSTGYGNYMNSHKKTNFQVTPSFILEALNKITENQLKNEIEVMKFTEQIKSHLALIQEYRKENISWRKNTEKKIREEFKNKEQTKLGDFL